MEFDCCHIFFLLRRIVCFLLIVVTLFISFVHSEYSISEFGNVLQRPVRSTLGSDHELIQFLWQYAEKRYVWSVPWSHDNGQGQPDIVSFDKMELVYSHDNKQPLYYDNEVVDRSGYRHGITSLLPLGTSYRIGLSWKHKTLTFTHNFTVSIYPKDKINIYSHTCFVQSFNATAKIETAATILIPNYLSTNRVLKQESHKKLYSISERDFDYQEMGLIDPEDYLKTEHLKDLNFGDSDKCLNDNCEHLTQERNSPTTLKYTKFMSKQFTVMSFNIWNMNSKSTRKDGYATRMERVKKTIVDADPDIIALQEVRYEEIKGGNLGPCQIQTLSDWLPQYQYIYQPAQMQPNTLNDGRTEEGVAIMSKYPIISHDYLLLFINRSNSADTHQRILLHAEIYIPLLGKVHIYTTHLSLSHEAREQSVVQIWKYIKQFKGPAILLGDLNAEPQERAMQYLGGKSVFPGEEPCLLVDVWTHTHMEGKLSGNTYNSLLKNLTKRIDYIFYNDDTEACEIKTCQVLDDSARGLKAASDHIPVMATFSFHDKSTSQP